jgi:putative SOS response-associated peptidase YedK
MAGLWEKWTKGPEPLETCVIITTNACDRAADVHDRMPVIFPIERAKQWLSIDSTEADLLAMLSPYDAADLDSYDVATVVNNPANDSADCIRPVDESDSREKSSGADALSLFPD